MSRTIVAPVLSLGVLLCGVCGPAFADPPAGSAAPSTSAVPSGSTVPAMSAADVAAKLQKTYESITVFDADFEQQYTMKTFNSKKEQSGHVVFEKPGKMRWDYSSPSNNVVVSDGKTLWSYEAKDKQARKMLVKDSQQPAALAFLTGKGDLSKEFNLAIATSLQQDFKGGYVLDATPKVATNLYTHVFFFVDGATFQVRRVLIVDGQDNRNRFNFLKPTVNGKVDPSKFVWTPPAGVTVITN
jgi:outer membrane lipoprotein carrier protein